MVEDCQGMQPTVGQVALEAEKAIQAGGSVRVECEVVALSFSV